MIVYSNLIRRFFKHTRPIVLGGIEASLRRIAHYDFWSDRMRGSVLFDAKADYLLYGMAEKSVLELAAALRNEIGYDGGVQSSTRFVLYSQRELERVTWSCRLMRRWQQIRTR